MTFQPHLPALCSPCAPLGGDPVPALAHAGAGDPGGSGGSCRAAGAPPTCTAGAGARLADEGSIALLQSPLDCILWGEEDGKGEMERGKEGGSGRKGDNLRCGISLHINAINGP